MNNIRMAILFLGVCLGLTSCAKNPSPQEHENYRCSYKNVSTKNIFYAENKDRIKAIYSAQKACRAEEAPFNCYLRYCERTSG